MRRKALLLVAALLVTALATAVTACASEPAQTPSSESRDSTTPRQLAQQVVTALEAKNGAALRALVHPRLGVRFSPYASVDTSSDVVLPPEEAARLWKDMTVRSWGFADGSGEEIRMTGAEYAARYIWDRDFTKASSVGMNADRASGNTVNNAAEVYRGSVRVEYYIEPSVAKDGTSNNDWAALRLVFEKSGDRYYLVGIIHDQWTI